MKRRLTRSQLKDICALPEHEDAVLPTEEGFFPSSTYVDPERFEHESQRLIRRKPLPLLPSSILPRPNTVYAHDSLGVPIILTRDQEGQLRGFFNVCSHRGAKLLDGETVKECKRLTCPYHAWSYDLKGQLLAVPKSEVFPSLKLEERGLKEMAVREAGGIIWAGLDPNHDYDFDNADTLDLIADLDAFGLGDMYHYKHMSYDLKANWKLLIETFLEPYHVPPVHKSTVSREFAEVPTAVSYLGPHSRQTIGRLAFTTNKVEDLEDLDPDELRSNVTHAYQVFPTCVMVTSPQHINFMFMNPRAADRTIVECHMLTNNAPKNEKEEAFFAKTFEFNMVSVFGKEDFPQAVSVQSGLSTGVLENVNFGGLERACSIFHQNIDRYVQGLEE